MKINVHPENGWLWLAAPEGSYNRSSFSKFLDLLGVLKKKYRFKRLHFQTQPVYTFDASETQLMNDIDSFMMENNNG